MPSVTPNAIASIMTGMNPDVKPIVQCIGEPPVLSHFPSPYTSMAVQVYDFYGCLAIYMSRGEWKICYAPGIDPLLCLTTS